MRKSKLFRMGCFVCMGIFFSLSVAWAVNSDPGKITSSVQSSSIEQLLNLRIPADWGIVKDSYNSGSDKIIINIQDTHCDFEAQQNIARILNVLALNHKLKIVALEGASGKVENPLLLNFPDKKVKESVSLYLVKQGKLTGAEYLAVNSDYDLKLYGVEDLRLYMDNLDAFQQSQPFKKEAKGYLDSINNSLDMLKPYIYNDNLKKLDILENDYALRRVSFDKYAIELYKIVEEQGLGRVNYPIFYELQNVIDLELNIDFKKADSERMQLITVLTQVSSDKQTTAKLVEKSLDFKKGMVSSGELANYLKYLAFELKLNMGEYPNFNAYAEYITKYEQVANEKLFSEIRLITQALKNRFYDNDDQKQLDVLYKYLGVLVKLVDLKMDNDDIGYFFKNRDQINSDRFIKFIEPQAYKYKVVTSLPPSISYIDLYVPEWVKFYELADTRDSAFITKTLDHMDKDNADCAALITGGFHTKQLTEILKKKRISYIVIAPKASVTGENPYFNIIQGGKSDVESFVTQMQSALAIFRGADAASLDKLSPTEQAALKTMAKTEEEVIILSLVVESFGLIAANPDNAGLTDNAIQGKVMDVFAQMPEGTVNMAFVRDILGKISKQENKQEAEIVLKDGSGKIVLNPAIPSGQEGRISVISNTQNKGIMVAAAGSKTVDQGTFANEDLKSNIAVETSAQNIYSPTAEKSIAAIGVKVSTDAVIDEALGDTVPSEKAIRAAFIIGQVLSGNDDIDAIANKLTVEMPKLASIPKPKQEIGQVVAKTKSVMESLILQASPVGKSAAVIALRELGINDETAVTIVQNNFSDIDLMRSELGKQAGVSSVTLINALNTGLTKTSTSAPGSAEIIAKLVVSKLNIRESAQKIKVTNIIKENINDAQAMTSGIAKALNENPSEVSEALFAGLKQSAVAANPIISDSYDIAKLPVAAQAKFMASNLKGQNIQSILDKAGTPAGQMIATMDDKVLNVAAQAGLGSDKIAAVLISPGDYSESAPVSVQILKNGKDSSGKESYYVVISPDISTMQKTEPTSYVRNISNTNKDKAVNEDLDTIVAALCAGLSQSVQDDNLEAKATAESTNKDPATLEKGKEVIFVPMSMYAKMIKGEEEGTVGLKLNAVYGKVQENTSKHITMFVYDDYYGENTKQTVSPELFDQFTKLKGVKIEHIGPMDAGAVDGTFIAKPVTPATMIAVAQNRCGKVNNACIVAPQNSVMSSQVVKLQKRSDSDADVNLVTYDDTNLGAEELLNADIPIAQAVHILYRDRLGTDTDMDNAKTEFCKAVLIDLVGDESLKASLKNDFNNLSNSFGPTRISIKDLDIKVFTKYVKATTFA